MATVKFYLKNKLLRGEVRKDEAQISCRVTLDRSNRFEIATGERILIQHWDSVRQQAKTTFRYHVEFNQHLSQIKHELIQIWRENRKQDFEVVRALCRDAVKHEVGKTRNLFEAFADFVAQYQSDKSDITSSRYKALGVVLAEFDKIYPISFERMDFNFYDHFKSFLYQRPNPNYPNMFLHKENDYWVMSDKRSAFPVGIFDDTVFKYIICMKTFLAWAAKREYPVNRSFEKWEIIRREYKHISLNLAELEQLESAIIPKNLELCRDYMIIECRTGQRISDILAFNPNQYQNNTWSFFRKKGNRLSTKQVRVHFKGFSEKALHVFIKHNFQLPKITKPTLNKYIKKIGKLAGIDKETYIERWMGNKCVRISGPKYEFISTHTGRKTFITIALQFMPAKIVKDLTGIESYKTLKHYEDESDSDIIEDYLNKIEEGNYLRKAQ